MSDHHDHGPVTRAGETADDALHHAEHGGHEHGHGGLGVYLAVFLALCFLTTMSFLTFTPYWPWRDQPQVGWAFMMAVSCTKALLVVLFFMHVPDVGMRNRMVSQERALHMARPSDVRLMEEAGAARGPADHGAAH